MRLQFQILFFIACLNIAVGLCLALGVPGTEWAAPINATGNVLQYEERWNATKVVESWNPGGTLGVPLIGDIYSAMYLFFNQVRFLIDGFPMLLEWIADMFHCDAGGRLAFSLIANGLRALFAFLMATLVVEMIGGRYLND